MDIVEQDLAQHASSPWCHTSGYKIGHAPGSTSLCLANHLELHAMLIPMHRSLPFSTGLCKLEPAHDGGDALY